MVLSLLIMSGCAPALLVPLEDDVRRANSEGNVLTLENLKQGHTLYINKCGSCHFLYRPYQFTKEKWHIEMPEMKKEAKLTDEEYKLIYNYVLIMQDVQKLN